MRTSLIEIEKIEAYLQGEMSPEDALLLEANMTLDEDLAEKISLQKQVYQLVKTYGRRSIRKEIATVQNKLFTLPEHADFRNTVLNLFRRKR